MPRPDLLALSPDDLAALANRGLVKRAALGPGESLMNNALHAAWRWVYEERTCARAPRPVQDLLDGLRTRVGVPQIFMRGAGR